MLEERRLARAGRRDDQPALAAAYGGNQVQRTRGIAFRTGFKGKALGRVDRLEFFKMRMLAGFLRKVSVDGGDFRQQNAAVMAASLPVNPHGGAQAEFADHVLRDVHGLRKSVKIIVRLPQKAESLVRNLQQAVHRFRRPQFPRSIVLGGGIVLEIAIPAVFKSAVAVFIIIISVAVVGPVGPVFVKTVVIALVVPVKTLALLVIPPLGFPGRFV